MSDKPCSVCNGSGQVDEIEWVADEMHVTSKSCGACGGTGRQP